MSITDEAIRCTSCEKPKFQLKQKKSKVLPGIPMYLCQDCLDSKREPRGFIILAGREFGMEHIAYWVKPQRYIGEPITIRELT